MGALLSRQFHGMADETHRRYRPGQGHGKGHLRRFRLKEGQPIGISGTVREKGRVSGPTTSTVSPVRNLLRRLRVASPSGVQSVTTAQICQSRI